MHIHGRAEWARTIKTPHAHQPHADVHTTLFLLRDGTIPATHRKYTFILFYNLILGIVCDYGNLFVCLQGKKQKIKYNPSPQ